MRPFEFVGGPLDGLKCGLRMEGDADVPAEWVAVMEVGYFGPVGYVRKEHEGGYELDRAGGDLPLRMVWKP